MKPANCAKFMVKQWKCTVTWSVRLDKITFKRAYTCWPKFGQRADEREHITASGCSLLWLGFGGRLCWTSTAVVNTERRSKPAHYIDMKMQPDTDMHPKHSGTVHAAACCLKTKSLQVSVRERALQNADGPKLAPSVSPRVLHEASCSGGQTQTKRKKCLDFISSLK